MESSIVELSKYRYQTAIENLETARLNYREEMFKQSVNRSYYSIFHAIRALTALPSRKKLHCSDGFGWFAGRGASFRDSGTGYENRDRETGGRGSRNGDGHACERIAEILKNS